MTIPLVERAEELKLEDLSQINLSQSQAYNASLFKEHLSSSFDYPRVLLSLKGGGKTVVARKALNSHIQENQESLPVMLVYKQNNRSEILDYNKLATPGQWGEKRLEILKKSSTKELMKRASAIVYDDAHYRFEAVADGREEPQRFLKELKEILEKAKKDTSTIILSENSLGVYSEQVNIEGLDDILAKCGQFSYEKWLNSNFEEKIEYQNSINYHACSEISPLKECEWSNAFYTYGIHVETPIDKILFRINPAPRAVVKFAKTFSPEREIDIEMFNEKTMEILSTEKIKTPEKLKLYGALMESPIIEPRIGIDTFSRVLNIVQGNFNTLEELYINLPTIRYICEEAVRQLKSSSNCDIKNWEKDTALALRKAEKKDWSAVQNALQNSMKKFTEEEKEKLQPLVKTFYKKPVMSKFVGVYETLLRIRGKRRCSIELMNYSAERNIKSYYFEDKDTGEWILYAPFKDAFTDFLRETPTLEFLASLK